MGRAKILLRTLAIDIGGTGIKMLPLDGNGTPTAERHRELTPRGDDATADPSEVLAVIGKMVDAQKPFDRVSVGFPGVVVRGVVHNAPNLGSEVWQGFDLAGRIRQLTGKPVRALNDAELQGYGVIKGDGVELALTLGTGVGTALYSDGHLVPNLEFGHHPWEKGKTYEERLSNAELKRVGKKKWSRRVIAMLDQLQPIFNCDVIYLGGGNTKKLDADQLADRAILFTNEQGLRGGVAVWSDGAFVDA